MSFPDVSGEPKNPFWDSLLNGNVGSVFVGRKISTKSKDVNHLRRLESLNTGVPAEWVINQEFSANYVQN